MVRQMRMHDEDLGEAQVWMLFDALYGVVHGWEPTVDVFDRQRTGGWVLSRQRRSDQVLALVELGERAA